MEPTGRPSRAGRLLRPSLVFATLAASLVALAREPGRVGGLFDSREGVESRARRAAPERAEAFLVGNGAPGRGRGSVDVGNATAPSGGSGGPAADATSAAGAAAVVPAPFRAVAPPSIDDRIAPDSYAPFLVDRADIVGRVGAYGVRDEGGASPRRWLGLARVARGERASWEAGEDTKDPATTAVHGVVVGPDGGAVAGAEVILYSSFYVRQSFYDHRVLQIGRVRTDATGVFDVRPIALDTVHFGAGGDVFVTVRHPDRPDVVAQALPAVVPGRESDVGRLVLPASALSIHGTVRDLGGRPVADAVVRASGVFDPVAYDKTERLIVLDECPSARTDALGRYALGDVAAGVHWLSVQVRSDVVRLVSDRWEGDRDWSPTVTGDDSVRGHVVDPDGRPVAAAVVVGGGNWTPTLADGTFWLDNVTPGPLRLEVVHHAWHTVLVPGVPTNGADVVVTMRSLLPRVTLAVVDAAKAPVPLVAIDWVWPPGGGPTPFTPVSRYWNDPHGVFAVVVPEGATGATVSDAKGAACVLAAEDLVDGALRAVVLESPATAR